MNLPKLEMVPNTSTKYDPKYDPNSISYDRVLAERRKQRVEALKKENDE